MMHHYWRPVGKEMKFKQDQREKRKRLKEEPRMAWDDGLLLWPEELEMMSHAGGVDLGRVNRLVTCLFTPEHPMARLRLELSAVEAYLAKTDGIHTLQDRECLCRHRSFSYAGAASSGATYDP